MRHSKRRGLTIIEVQVALLILLVGILTAVALAPLGMKGTNLAKGNTLAMNYGRHLMEAVRAVGFTMQHNYDTSAVYQGAGTGSPYPLPAGFPTRGVQNVPSPMPAMATLTASAPTGSQAPFGYFVGGDGLLYYYLPDVDSSSSSFYCNVRIPQPGDADVPPQIKNNVNMHCIEVTVYWLDDDALGRPTLKSYVLVSYSALIN